MKAAHILSLLFLGIWLVACSHSGTPKPTEPTKQEAPEKESAEKPSSTETAESKSKEAQKQTESGQAGSEDATRSKEEEAAKDSTAAKPSSAEPPGPESAGGSPQTTESDPKESAGTAESSRPKSAETANKPAETEAGRPSGKAEGGRPASPETADEKLAKAREDLRVSQATEKRIASELEELKKSGTASAETIRDYEIYHESVKAMVAENQKIVDQMEAASARHASGKQSSSAAASGRQDKLMDPDIPEEQTTDEVAALDRELSASLSEFDEKLLREMDTIREESADKMQDLAEEAAAAAKRLRERLKESESGGSGEKDRDESESAEDDAQAKTDQQSGEKSETSGGDREESASTDAARGGGQGPQKDSPKRYEGAEDDDIVARQLREAAENETDPVLKEKLWKEYEEYKKNQS